MTRSRNWIGNANLRVATSIGYLDDMGVPGGVTMNLSWSDDGGATYSDPISIPLVEGSYSQEVSYDGLGSFQSPGRVFQISDSGGPLRIDGADAGVNNFDDDAGSGGG